MCISLTLKRYRLHPCSSNITAPEEKQNMSTKDLCSSWVEDDNWWYSPELDIDNNNHFVLYNSAESPENKRCTNKVINICRQFWPNERIFEERNLGHLFPNTLWIVAPSEEIIIKTSLFLPLVLWGIFGNMSLLYIILKNRHLRTPTNMIIANMATVDLISILIYPAVFLICDFFQNYQLGEFGCKMDGWLECSLLLINVMNLSTISYDRLTAIVLPRETRLTRKGAKKVIVVTWISSFLISCPLIIYRQYRQRQWSNFLEIYCTENAKALAIYWHILLVMLVWIPLAIMLICYTAIFIKLDRYEQKVLKREHPLAVCYKTKVAKVLFIVVATFVACRIPFTALIFKRNQWLKTNEQNQILGANQILWFVAKYLIYANAALDPLIYGLTNENFRRALRTTTATKIFFPKKKKIPIKEKMTVKVIEPRGPYRTDQKSDAWLINQSKNSCDFSKERSVDSNKTDVKNILF